MSAARRAIIAVLVCACGAALLAGLLSPEPVGASRTAGPLKAAGTVVDADAALTFEGALTRATSPSGRTLPLPPPTENWLDHDAEQNQKKARKAWMAQMRKGAPDVDWRATERRNGLAQQDRRNAMAAGGVPPPLDAAWAERGSMNQAGRMMVARLTDDGGTLYAGSSLGGVWRGNPDGTGWEPLGDNLYGGAHWLELTDDGADRIILAATDSGLVHWSDDEGQIWTVPTGLPELSSIRRITQKTDGSDQIYMVAYDGTYDLYRSEDGGQHWTMLLDLGSFAGDVWVPRDGGGVVALATSSGLQTSADSGDSWTAGGTWPTSPGRVELVASEAGSPRFYAAIDGTGLYTADGATGAWTYLHPFEEYWGAINASVTDEDVVVYGGVNAFRFHRSDGNRIINYWWEYYDNPEDLLHADNMGIDVMLDGDGDETWFINTDGGTYVSTDTVQTVRNLSLEGLRVSQYYSTLTDSENPEYVAAGAQDQGYQVTGGVAQDGELLYFDQTVSGDYAHLVSGDGTHEWVYSVYPGFILVQHGAEDVAHGYLDFPEGENASWLPPLAADPYDRQDFFFCATQLYKYTRAGATWQAQVWSGQDFDSNGSEYLSGLVFSPVDAERAYATTNYGRVFTSDDHGVTWTESSSRVAYPQYLSGNALVASSIDKDTVYVGGSGYGLPSVYRSTDGGLSFHPWSDGIDDTLVYSLAEAPDYSGTLLAGTQTTVYRRDDADTEWRDVSDNTAPVTIYWSAEALTLKNTIRFGTYGRGIWDYQLDPDGEACFPVVDDDGDGAWCTQDCDESDDTVFPGAEEVCGDGIDQDCDGEDTVCPDTDAPDEDTGDADTGDPTEEDDTDEPDDDRNTGADAKPADRSAGCGCSTGTADPGPPAGFALLGLLGLLTLRRREVRR
jgi:MYXO-CTERM domain-containing protein